MKTLRLISIFSLTIVCFGCTTLADFNDNANEWKPKFIDLKNQVLVIESGAKWKWKKEKEIKDFMEENYPFQYKFIYPFDLSKDTLSGDNYLKSKDGDFNDKGLFRFVLRPTFRTKVIESSDDNRTTESHDLYFYDRLLRKEYNVTGISCSNPVVLFKKVIKTLLE